MRKDGTREGVKKSHSFVEVIYGSLLSYREGPRPTETASLFPIALLPREGFSEFPRMFNVQTAESNARGRRRRLHYFLAGVRVRSTVLSEENENNR